MMDMNMNQEQQQSMVMRLWLLLQRWIDAFLKKIRVQYTAMESFLNAAIGVWVVVFFANPHLFELSPVMYKPMIERGTPADWGWKALTLIAIWIVAIRYQNIQLRYLSLALNVGWYFYLTALFLGTGQISFGGGLHLLGLVYSFWCGWRFAGRKHDPK